jgi:hypothetical protein
MGLCTNTVAGSTRYVGFFALPEKLVIRVETGVTSHRFEATESRREVNLEEKQDACLSVESMASLSSSSWIAAERLIVFIRHHLEG